MFGRIFTKCKKKYTGHHRTKQYILIYIKLKGSIHFFLIIEYLVQVLAIENNFTCRRQLNMLNTTNDLAYRMAQYISLALQRIHTISLNY